MLQDDFIKIAKSEELKPGKPLVRGFLGKKVALFLKDNSVYAMEYNCKHQGADLSTGLVKGEEITCAHHGWRYNLVTGQCIFPKEGLPLRFYDVQIEEGTIWISKAPVSKEPIIKPV